MKKVFMLFAALLAVGTMMAQTIVPTTPQNRKVVIEELTGIYCQWCPAGHKVVNEIISQYPDKVAGINVHAGYFSQGSPYNTEAGEAYDTQANPDGYPAGTVNRHNFGSGTALGRGDFLPAAQMIMNEVSPVNVAAVAYPNAANRQITLHIEIYYTGNSTVETNYLNIAVLQNNVLGQQSGGQANYPEMMVGSQYRHMHMLREMLTGTWGVPIPATQGTFIDTTIVYDVPEAIGSVAIPTIDDIDFVVFVAEGHQEIITGTKAIIPTEVPMLANLSIENEDCSLSYQPYVTVFNTTEQTLSSFTFDNDGSAFTASKLIPMFQADTIHLPVHTINVSGADVQQCTTTKTVSLSSCVNNMGQVVDVNSDPVSVTFADFNIYTAAGPFTLRYGIDHWGSEAQIQFVNMANCSTVWAEGPWSDLPGNPQNVSQLKPARYHETTFSPDAAGLYILRLVDAYGDGWAYATESAPAGIWLSNADGQIMSEEMYISNSGQFYGPTFSQLDYYLNVTNAGDGSHNTVGIDEVANVQFSVYPNPATEYLTIESSEALREVNVIDVAGRTVMSLGATQTINVSGLASGVYMLRVVSDNGVGMQKFVKE